MHFKHMLQYSNMFSLFSSQKNDFKGIILDIQSGLVRGALINKRKTEEGVEETTILSIVTRSINTKHSVTNSEQLTKKTLKLISDVMDHLIKDAGTSKISRIDYILSSPWIFSKFKTIKIKYDVETRVTSKTIANIISKEVANSSTKDDTEPVDQKIFEIRLNGYPTEMFDDKMAHELDISISTSFTSKSLLKKIKEVIEKHSNIKEGKVHSALILQYTALRELLKNNNEFIYIHVHNELTDLIMVKDSLCRNIASFPFGVNVLLRKISAVTKESLEASDSTLSLFQGEKLSDEEKVRMNKIIEPLMAEWVKFFTNSFGKIFDISNLPRTLYLATHSHYDLFKNSLTFKSEFNFEILNCDTIGPGKEILLGACTQKSEMIRMYTSTLYNEI